MLALIGTFWLINKPEDVGQRVDGEPVAEQDSLPNNNPLVSKTYKTSVNWSLTEAIRSRVLWLIIIIYMAQVMPLYLLMVHGSLHFTDLNFSRLDAASVLSFMVAGSAFARFPVGWLGDRIEPRYIMTILNSISVLALVVIWQAPSLTWLLIMAPLFGVAMGGNIVMLPTMVGNYFGKDSFASINGFILPLQVVFSAMVPVCAGYIADATGTYDWPFMALILLVAIAIILSIAATPPRKLAA